MKYRRAWIPGGSYFFTVVTDHRRPLLATESAVEVLRQAFRTVRAKRPFAVDAMVVLPDHLHCIWSLPAGDADHSRRWQFIKASFARRLQRQDGCVSARVWQARCWEHWLRDETDFRRHLDYIHYNPVKHGHADRPADWLHSSFQKCVERGIYPLDWASGGDIKGEFGE